MTQAQALHGIRFFTAPLNTAPRPWTASHGQFTPSPVLPGPILDSEEHAFADHVLRSLGLDLAHYRQAPLQRRLKACLRAMRQPDLASARQLIDRRPELLHTAATCLLVGVTDFFRDPAAFNGLAAHLAALPPQSPLHVWSVGCSTGAEVYSIAMLLAETGRLDHAQLIGTDCRLDAVEHAGRGIYHADELRGLAPHRLDRWFTHEAGHRYRIAPELRRRCNFQQHDALSPLTARFNLILCRNVTIYLQPDAADRLWRNLHHCLADGGLLFVGKAERPPRHVDLHRLDTCLYQRRTR